MERLATIMSTFSPDFNQIGTLNTEHKSKFYNLIEFN